MKRIITIFAVLNVCIQLGALAAPVANNDSGNGFNTDQNTTFTTGNVLINDTGVSPLSVGLVNSSTSRGSVANNENGTFNYNPNGKVSGEFYSLGAGEFATDSFNYFVKDGNNVQSSLDATVSISVAGVNDDPVAQNDNISTNEDNPVNGNVLNNNGFGADSDIDTNDILSVSEVNGSSSNVNGQITLNSNALLLQHSNGSFTYNPNGAFEYLAFDESTNDSFTYTIYDGKGGTASATVSITINGVNDNPVAEDDVYTIDEDMFLDGNVLANDSDPDTSDELNVIDLNVGSPNSDIILPSGAILNVKNNGDFTYDPNSNTYESALITYKFVYNNNGTILDLDDDQLRYVNLPFDFKFFNKIYTGLFVSSNGFLSFDLSNNDSATDAGSIPNFDSPNNIIAGYWADLNPSAGGSISYHVMGLAPHRVFVVEYKDVPHYDENNEENSEYFNVTFQIKLFEGTNEIEVHCKNCESDGTEHTMGVENITGTLSETFSEANFWDNCTESFVAIDSNASTAFSLCHTAVSFSPVIYDGFDNCDVDCSDGFAYMVQDSYGATATATVTINIIQENDAPVIDLSRAKYPFEYCEGTGKQYLFANGVIYDSDTPILKDGKLILSWWDGGSWYDNLTIESPDHLMEVEIGGIYLLGNLILVKVDNFVCYEVGEFVGGENGRELIVFFTENGATLQAVNALFRSIKYENTQSDPLINLENPEKELNIFIADGDDEDGAVGAATYAYLPIEIYINNDVPIFRPRGNVTILEDSGPRVIHNWAGSANAGSANEQQILEQGPYADNGLIFDVEVDEEDQNLFSVQPHISANGDLSFTPAPDAYGNANVVAAVIDHGTGAISKHLYGVTSNNSESDESVLYEVDATTGAATAIGYGTGFSRISAMDFDARGNLYAVGRNDYNKLVLILINTVTGEGSQIGKIDPNNAGIIRSVTDMTYDEVNDILYVVGKSNSDCGEDSELYLARINEKSGEATILVDCMEVGGFSEGNGLAYTATGELIHAGNMLNYLIPEIGLPCESTVECSAIIPLEFISNNNQTPINNSDIRRVNGMDFRPSDGALFALLNNSEEGSEEIYLTKIDAVTGAVTLIGPTVDRLDALAWAPVNKISANFEFTITIKPVNDAPVFVKGVDQAPDGIEGYESGVIYNFGFETGDLTSWQSTGIVSVINSSSFDVGPLFGNYQVGLSTGGSSGVGSGITYSDTDLEFFLGLDSNTLDNLGNGDAIEGSAIKQTFWADAGDVIFFSYNFLTNEVTPSAIVNDFAFVTISGNGVGTLSDTNDFFVLSTAKEFNAETGYQQFWYEVPEDGEYTIGIGIVDVGDGAVESILLIDHDTFTLIDGTVMVNEDSGIEGRHAIPIYLSNIEPGGSGDFIENEQDLWFTVDVPYNNQKIFSENGQPNIEIIGNEEDGLTGILHFTLKENANGNALLTIRLHDNGGTADGGVDTSRKLNCFIMVLPREDFPIKHLNESTVAQLSENGIDEDSGPQYFADFADYFSTGGGWDENRQGLQFLVTVDNSSGSTLFSKYPRINKDGGLSFTPADNANGTAEVSVILAQVVSFDKMYGAAYDENADQSVLYELDAETGGATKIGDGIGFTRVSGMDTDSNGVIYATGARLNDGAIVLLTINPLNGRGTEVGPTLIEDLPYTVENISDISFDSEDRLYAFIPCDVLGFIDTDTGEFYFVGFIDDCSGGNGIGFSLFDDLYHANEDYINLLDQETGETFDYEELTFSSPFSENARINAMDFYPYWDGSLYASVRDGSSYHLVTVDPNTGNVSNIDDTVDNLDAITWGPELIFSDVMNFQIVINAVNDNPLVNRKIPDITVAEDSTLECIYVDNVFDDVDIVTNDDSIEIGIANISDTNIITDATLNFPFLCFSIGADEFGDSEITLIATDEHGGTATVSFTIHVTPVNDNPSFTVNSNNLTLTVLEDSGSHTVNNWANNITAGPNEDQEGQELEFLVNTNNPELFSDLYIDANGTLHYTVAGNANGAATVSVILTDNTPSRLFGAAHSGSNGNSTLYLIDASTGQASGVGSGIGVDRVSGMDFDTYGNLFATGEINGDPVFAIIDQHNGTAQVMAGITSQFVNVNDITDISFDPFTGELYAIMKDTFQPLGILNLHDENFDLGEFILIGYDTVNSTDSGNGLAFSGMGTLLHSSGQKLNSVDVNSGLRTLFQRLRIPVSANIGPRFNALEFKPKTSLLYGSLVSGFEGSSTNYLATINVQTGQVRIIGKTVKGLDALAWEPAAFSEEVTLTINITPVNDAPSFVKGPDIDNALTISGSQLIPAWATKITKGPSDESGQSLTFDVKVELSSTDPNPNNTVNGNDPDAEALFTQRPVIDSVTGDLTFSPIIGKTGKVKVTVTLKDNGLTANNGNDTSSPQVFFITINKIIADFTFLNGLQGYWPLEALSCATILNKVCDLSGNNNTGTAEGSKAPNTNGPILASGVPAIGGNAFSFDGIDDKVKIPTSTSLNANITSKLSMAAWVNPTAAQVSPFGGMILNNEGRFEMCVFPDGTIRFALKVTTLTNVNTAFNPAPLSYEGWSRFTNTGKTIPLNQWSHVALTYDSTITAPSINNIKVYVNGIQVYQGRGVGALGDHHPTENETTIGNRQTIATQPFKGIIDEAYVFNNALTLEQVNLIKDDIHHRVILNQVETDDFNKNGFIDTLILKFDRPVNDTTANIANFTLSNPSVATPSFNFSRGVTNDNILYISFNEGISKTDIKPKITYATGSLVSLDGKLLKSVDLIAVDRARPVITGSSLNLGTGILTMTWSESISPTAANRDLSRLRLTDGLNKTTLLSQATSSSVSGAVLTVNLTQSQRLALIGYGNNNVKLNTEINAVRDLAGNFNVLQTNLSVTVIPDTVAKITTVNLNNNDGTLEINFDKNISKNRGDFDISKYTLQFVSGTTTPVNLGDSAIVNKLSDTKIIIDLDECTRPLTTDLSLQASQIKLDVQSGAFKDLSGTGNDARNGIVVVRVNDTTAPKALVSFIDYNNYDCGKGIVAIYLDEVIDGDFGVDLTKITVKNASGDATGINLAGASVDIEGECTSLIIIELTEEQRVQILPISQDFDGGEVIINLASGAFKDLSGVANQQDPDLPVIEQADRVKPAIESATLDYNNGILEITFCETLSDIYNLVTNGGFEDGLNGWNQENHGDGEFVINDGSLDPDGPEENVAPCDGSLNSISVQNGPGSHILYQDITIPEQASFAILSWTDIIHNHALLFDNEDQAFKVQVFNENGRLLTEVFSTEYGDDPFTECTDRYADLSEFIGQTIRLAFVQEDLLFFFNLYIDNVAIYTDIPNVDLGKVFLSDASITCGDEFQISCPGSSTVECLGGAQVINVDGPTLTIQLTNEQREHALRNSDTAGGNGEPVILHTTANVFYDFSGNSNDCAEIQVIEIADTTPPTVVHNDSTKPLLDLNSRILTVWFSESIDDVWDISLFEITDVAAGTSTATVSLGNANYSLNGNQIIFDLSFLNSQEWNLIKWMSSDPAGNGDCTSAYLNVLANAIDDIAGVNNEDNLNVPVEEIIDTPYVVDVPFLDLSTGTIEIVFSENITVECLADNCLNGITISNGSNEMNLGENEFGREPEFEVYGNTLYIELTHLHRLAALELYGEPDEPGNELFIALESGLAFDNHNNGNIKNIECDECSECGQYFTNNIELEVAPDDLRPQVVGALVDLNVGVLTILVNEKYNPDSINLNKFHINNEPNKNLVNLNDYSNSIIDIETYFLTYHFYCNEFEQDEFEFENNICGLFGEIDEFVDEEFEGLSSFFDNFTIIIKLTEEQRLDIASLGIENEPNEIINLLDGLLQVDYHGYEDISGNSNKKEFGLVIRLEDNLPPLITNVSSLNSNGNYGPGAEIDITVDFSETVFVNNSSGTPRLQLETGFVSREAEYIGGNGTQTLLFRYTVELGDSSDDLDYIGTDSLIASSTAIVDSFDNEADLILPEPGTGSVFFGWGSLGFNKNIIIAQGSLVVEVDTSFTDGFRENQWVPVSIRASTGVLQTLLFPITYNGYELEFVEGSESLIVSDMTNPNTVVEVSEIDNSDPWNTTIWISVDNANSGEISLQKGISEIVSLVFRVKIGAGGEELNPIDIRLNHYPTDLIALNPLGQPVLFGLVNGAIPLDTQYSALDVDEDGSVNYLTDGVFIYRAALYGNLDGLVPIKPHGNEPYLATDAEIIANVRALAGTDYFGGEEPGDGDGVIDLNVDGLNNTFDIGTDAAYIYRHLLSAKLGYGMLFTLPPSHAAQYGEYAGQYASEVNDRINLLIPEQSDVLPPRTDTVIKWNSLVNTVKPLIIRFNESVRIDGVLLDDIEDLVEAGLIQINGEGEPLVKVDGDSRVLIFSTEIPWTLNALHDILDDLDISVLEDVHGNHGTNLNIP